MKKFIIRIFHFLWRLLNKVIISSNNSERKQLLNTALKFILSDDLQVGEIVYTVKEDTLEKVPLMRVINHIEGGEVIFNSPSVYLRKISDAIVFPSSDFVIIKDTAIWTKTRYPQFTKIDPLDADLIDYDDHTLYIRKPEKVIELDNGFSLCGVHSKIWAHFLVQYLPKLDYIQSIVETINHDLTVIIPQYKDHQIKEIVNTLLNQINGLTIFELQEDQVAKCKNLFYIENTSVLSDHGSYICPSDLLIPQFVLSFLKEKFVHNKLLFPEVYNEKIIPQRKLFIKRGISILSPLGGSRNLKNTVEIEQFFKEEGFEFISPHDFSLSDKRKLFNEARIIVGPASSGFTNIIFCQPGTKVLALMNFQRIYDLYISTIASYFKIDLYGITGVDDQPSNVHSSYFIPLEKVKNAYNNYCS